MAETKLLVGGGSGHILTAVIWLFWNHSLHCPNRQRDQFDGFILEDRDRIESLNIIF